MEESLKSARSVHLVLIGVCAAIALFAALPRETDKYLNARTELEALRMIDLADFVRHQKNLIIAHVSPVAWLQPQLLFPNGKIKTSLSPFDLFPFQLDEPAVKGLQEGAAIEEWIRFF